MHAAIDWLSFTIPLEDHGEYALSENWFYSRMYDMMIEPMRYMFDGRKWEIANGRPPYGASANYEGIWLYWGKPNHALVEIRGRGCDHLRSEGIETDVLRSIRRTCTRIDIAIDCVTQVSPQEFTGKAKSRKQRAKSIIVSETGTTVYIGSRKSNRYARVYRYNSPHPRHNMLRVEMVARKEDAKATVKFILENSLIDLLSHFTAIYGWDHPVWQIKAAKGALKAHRADRPEAKTIRWLITQVAPSFKRLVKDGIIQDSQEFLNEHFLQ